MSQVKSWREPDHGPNDWILEVHDRLDGSVPYENFRSSLNEYTRAVLDISIREILAKQGNNICNSPKYGRNLRKGLYEFKVCKPLFTICHEVGIQVPPGLSPGSSVLLRIFFTVEGAKVILLLGGYDKQKDDSTNRQNDEIRFARKLLAEHRERVKRKAKWRP